MTGFLDHKLICYSNTSACRDLRPTSLDKGQETFRLRLYQLYAWGGPLLIAGIAAILDNLPGEAYSSLLKPRFGQGRCWFYGMFFSKNNSLEVRYTHTLTDMHNHIHTNPRQELVPPMFILCYLQVRHEEISKNLTGTLLRAKLFFNIISIFVNVIFPPSDKSIHSCQTEVSLLPLKCHIICVMVSSQVVFQRTRWVEV